MADDLMKFWKHSQIRCNIFELEGNSMQNFLFSALAGLMILSAYQYLKNRKNKKDVQSSKHEIDERIGVFLTLEDLKERLANNSNPNSLEIKQGKCN